MFGGIYRNEPKAPVYCIQKLIRKAQDSNRMKAIESRRHTWHRLGKPLEPKHGKCPAL